MTNRRKRKHPCEVAGIHVEKCGPTGKISYRSEAAAMAALELAHAAAETQTRRREQRCYPCKYGLHFHLTSEAGLPRLGQERRTG